MSYTYIAFFCPVACSYCDEVLQFSKFFFHIDTASVRLSGADRCRTACNCTSIPYGMEAILHSVCRSTSPRGDIQRIGRLTGHILWLLNTGTPSEKNAPSRIVFPRKKQADQKGKGGAPPPSVFSISPAENDTLDSFPESALCYCCSTMNKKDFKIMQQGYSYTLLTMTTIWWRLFAFGVSGDRRSCHMR